MIALAFLSCTGPLSASTQREAGGNEEAVFLDGAAILLRDGQFERAEAMLANVDPGAKGVDGARYHTIRGALRLRRSRFSEAASDLEKAVRLGNHSPAAALALAHAYHGCGKYSAAIAAIDGAPEMPHSLDRLSLESDCLWKLGRVEPAMSRIGAAVGLYPTNVLLRKQMISYLLELGLTREAILQGEKFLDSAGTGSDAHLLYAEALRAGGEGGKAALVLEEARLRFIGDGRIGVALAGVFASLGDKRRAADIAEEAAITDLRYCGEAAERARNAGEIDRALHLNALVPEASVRERQRLSILLSGERYEQAATLDQALKESDIRKDAGIQYGVAYALFRLGRSDEAEALLVQISDHVYAERVSRLRKAMHE